MFLLFLLNLCFHIDLFYMNTIKRSIQLLYLFLFSIIFLFFYVFLFLFNKNNNLFSKFHCISQKRMNASCAVESLVIEQQRQKAKSKAQSRVSSKQVWQHQKSRCQCIAYFKALHKNIFTQIFLGESEKFFVCVPQLLKTTSTFHNSIAKKKNESLLIIIKNKKHFLFLSFLKSQYKAYK